MGTAATPVLVTSEGLIGADFVVLPFSRAAVAFVDTRDVFSKCTRVFGAKS